MQPQLINYAKMPNCDAVPDEKLGLLYPVRVELDKTSVDTGKRIIPLGPGLSATNRDAAGDCLSAVVLVALSA